MSATLLCRLEAAGDLRVRLSISRDGEALTAAVFDASSVGMHRMVECIAAANSGGGPVELKSDWLACQVGAHSVRQRLARVIRAFPKDERGAA